MAIMRRLQKGTNPPSVGGGGRKSNNKFIDWKQRRYMALKFIGEACGVIRRSTCYHPETNDAETADSAADGFKKRARSPSSGGRVKERSDEGKYNHFTILPVCIENISASVFHHFTMWNYVHSLNHFTIFVTPFHHNEMKFFIVTPFNHCVSPFHHVNFCVFYAPLHHTCFIVAPY